MVVGASPEDLEAAHKLVSTSPGYLSKWTKSELVSAALALRLFIRELPGGPKLLYRAADLAKSSNGEENERMARAVKAISQQDGVDASLVRPTQPGGSAALASAATSTQSPGEISAPNWEDLSQIPSNQGPGAGAGAGKGGDDDDSERDASGGGVDDGDDEEEKVSDHSSANVRSLAAPVQLPNGPHTEAGMGRVVDGDMNGTGVARVGGGGDEGANRRAKGALLRKTTSLDGTSWRPRVCNRVWKGKICNNRSSGCRFAHPEPCRSSKCASGPMPGCKAFHPRVGGVETSVAMGNGKGSARKGGAAPKRSKRDDKAPRPSSSNSGGNNGRKRTADGNGRSSGTASRNTGGTSSNPRLPQVSYRDVAARALTGASGSANTGNGLSSSGNNSNIPYFQALPARGGEFAHAQPDPAVLSTVVAAVMAVLSGGRQLF